jgi:putative sterol carrier protein
MKTAAALGIALAILAPPASAAPTMMAAEWAQQMCNAWNADATLTGKLVESEWIRNDKGRGYKAMQIYRADCADSARIELRVSEKDGKAVCVYGGKADSTLDTRVDYVMWAETARWIEMGKGEYGPMKAMFLQRLGFNGPMMEAMGNMGPFESFLLLVGKVPGEVAGCPAK